MPRWLPDIDGVEMTRRLKAVPECAAIPVVMITGEREKSVIVESLAAGGADFIAKPFERKITEYSSKESRQVPGDLSAARDPEITRNRGRISLSWPGSDQHRRIRRYPFAGALRSG